MLRQIFWIIFAVWLGSSIVYHHIHCSCACASSCLSVGLCVCIKSRYKQWTLTFSECISEFSYVGVCADVYTYYLCMSYQWQLTVAVKLQTKVIYSKQPEIVKITLNQLYPFTWSLPLRMCEYVCVCMSAKVDAGLLMLLITPQKNKYVPKLFTATTVSVLSFIVTVTRRCTFAFCLMFATTTWKRHQFHHISVLFISWNFPSVS